jgi:hypothetical protein
MSALGSLVVKLGLEYATFTGGLDKSEQAALASAKRVQDTFDGLKSKLAGTAAAVAGGLAAGFTVAAFGSLISGAVSTGAALDDLAMQTGATVEALSALAEIGKYNDMSAEQIGGAMNMLARNMAGATEESRGAGKALEALGLDFDKFRQMRPEDQMQAVAKAMAGFEDGTGKSAVAMALYGKEGAKMLPFMHDLAEAGTLQARVTTEQAAASAQLDDNWLKLTTTGSEAAKEVAMGMVPALDEAVRAAMDVMNGTGGMRDMLRGLVADGSIQRWTTQAIKGLSYVADAGHVAWRVLESIGTGLGGFAAALVQALQGDIQGALATIKATGSDAVATFDDPTIGTRFRDSLDQLAHSASAVGEAAGAAKPSLDGFANTASRTGKAAADTMGKLAASGADLAASLLAQDSGLSGDFAKKWDSLSAAYRANSLSLEDLTAAQAQLLDDQPAMKAAADATTKAAQAAAEARTKEAQGIAAFFAAQDDAARQALQGTTERVDSLTQELQAMALAREQNISLARAIEEVAIARLRERQVGVYEGSATWAELQKDIDKRRELIGFIGNKEALDASAQAATAAQADWVKAAQGIEQSLTDALLRGFESGKDFAKNLRDTIVNMFKTLVLRPIISAVVNPVAGAITGALGLAGTAAAAQQGGAAGGLSTVVSGASLLGSMGGLGAGLNYGVQSLFANGIGTTFTAGTQMLGAGSIMGGLGTIAGMLTPLLALAALWKPLFGRSLKDSGIEGTFGGESGFEGQSYRYYKGGLFRSDKTEYSAVDEDVRRVLGDSFKAMKQQVQDFADVLGLSTERLQGYTSSIKLSTHGLSDADAQKKLQEALATANNDLAQQVIGTWETVSAQVQQVIAATFQEMEAGADAYRTETVDETSSTYTPSEFARDGEKAIDTLTRLATSLQLANGWFERLGVSVLEASLAGGDRASALIDKTGGHEAFDAQAATYFANYYSTTERRAAQLREVEKVFSDLGLEAPTSAAGFRQMLEAQLALGPAGDDAVAALLGVSGAFAEAIGSMGALEQAMGVSADSLKGILDDVLREAHSADEARAMASERFERSITDGLMGAMTQGLANMLMASVVGPLIDGLLVGATASSSAMATGGALAGASVATGGAVGGATAAGAMAAGGASAGAAMAQGGAMAGVAVATTIAQAQAFMASFAALLSDPGIQQQISDISGLFGDLAGDAWDVTGGFQSASTAMGTASSSAGGMADAMGDLTDSIDAEIKRLRGMMVQDSTVTREVLMARFVTDTAAARAGDQQALERLPELSRLIEEASRGTATGSVDLARTRGWLAGSLEETKRNYTAQTDAAHRAAMYAMTAPGYDPRDTGRYMNTWDATPVYTPWTEATVDSRYPGWYSNTPLPGTGNPRGQDPNYVPDYRYTDSWAASPYVHNSLPKYEQGTNYVPADGLAYLHEGEAVVPKAHNTAAARAGAAGTVVQELRALRAEVVALRTQQSAEHLAQQRTALRPAKLLERWELGGMPQAREGAAV